MGGGGEGGTLRFLQRRFCSRKYITPASKAVWPVIISTVQRMLSTFASTMLRVHSVAASAIRVPTRLSSRFRSDVLIRPSRERLNSISKTDHVELSKLLRTVAHDDATDVLLLQGAGRAFSIGGHFETVEELVSEPHALMRVGREVRELVRAHVDLEKPVVAVPA